MNARTARKLRKMLGYKVGKDKPPFQRLFDGYEDSLVAENKAANAYRLLKRKYLSLNKP